MKENYTNTSSTMSSTPSSTMSSTIKKSLQTIISQSVHDSVFDETTILVAIDVGIHHMGIVYAHCVLNELIIDNFDCVNITQFPCKRSLQNQDCPFQHTHTLTDYLDHFFLQYHHWFQSADVLLVERQPIMGQVAVEQLIYSRYRDKVLLVSPRSIHTFFRWQFQGSVEERYAQRKIHSVQIGCKHLTQQQIQKLYQCIRQHDVTDAICICVYWFYVVYPTRRRSVQVDVESDEKHLSAFFEQFYFKEK